MPKLMESFQRNLKKQRNRKGMSQEALAHKAGISTSFASLLERGQRTPTFDTIEALAEALGVTPQTLLTP